jgi:uncharacterized SAM-binding protein YcdF (DUF218 family)
MFFIKKFLSALLLPMSVGLGTIAVGLILMWFTRRQRAGRIVTTVGFGLLLLFSYSGVADLFVVPLENDYRPLLVDTSPGPLDEKARQARFIVVLGGGHSLDSQLPPSSELSEMTLARLVEALRLKRKLPEAKVILSGGFGSATTKHADLLAAAATDLGFSREDLILEKRTFDTADEAQLISRIIGPAPFILVSSASHLSRAVALFRKQGLEALPSPTDYTVIGASEVRLESFFPSASGVGKLERAWHEYLGRAWSRMRGQL